jgi:hypothetical protein
MYEYSMEHHTDWVNDIVLVNSGKHSKIDFLMRKLFIIFKIFKYFRHRVMPQLNYGMHQKEHVCQHYVHIK